MSSGAGGLTPQKVEPGWLRRWTVQSADIWRRAPWIWALLISAATALNALIPQPLGANVLIDVPLMGGAFLLIRLLDHHGAFSWALFWSMARDAGKDLWQLTRVAFLWIFFITILVSLVALTAQSAMHAVAPSGGLTGQLHQALRHAPALLQNAFWQSLGMMGNAAGPFTGPILFLTLYLGANTVYYLHLAYLGCMKNLPVAATFMALAISSPVPAKILTVLLAELVGNNAALLLTALVVSTFCLWMVTMGYLWSREMFEGTRENQPATAKTVLRHAMGGA